MFIKEVVLDGFKSYATRTVISGFDAEFNAITGLNGSGKSNVLDALCFVLGISNLSQVRVSELTDLVYKKGQAGVNKASVTIVFDNTDKAKSPIGYESYDELTVTRTVVIGGRNKYMINGHTAAPMRVHTMFHSVGLNVNNPHFLIMQGRITKVLNMKPAEIRGLIEEAAGTAMFEMKKADALKTMEKKQKKVEEIDQLIADVITPTLHNLQADQSKYMKWSNNNSEIERLSRLSIAKRYYDGERGRDSTEARIDSATADLERLQTLLPELEQSLEQSDHQAQRVRAKKESYAAGGEFAAAEERARALSTALVKASTALQHARAAVEGEREQEVALQAQLADATTALAAKRAAIEACAAAAEAASKAADAAKQASEDAVRCYDAMSGADGEAAGTKALELQLAQAKRELDDAVAAGKAAAAQRTHAAKELKQAEAERAKSAKDVATADAQRSKLAERVALLTKQRDAKAVAVGTGTASVQLSSDRASAQRHFAAAQEKADAASRKVAHVKFQWSAPEPGFDARRVKGLVAELVSVPDPAHATALEVTAGGRLWQAVVDTPETAKLLLQRGKLTRRVTLLPLSKIAGRTVSEERVKAAKALVGADNVHSALSLIKYDKSLEPAMRYAFGGTLVCRTLAEANRVAFNERVMTRCVTLGGDVVEPAGVMSGGSRHTGTPILTLMMQAHAATKEMQRAKAALDKAAAAMDAAEQGASAVAELEQQLDLAKHELQLLDAKQRVSPAVAAARRCDDLTARIAGLDAAAADVKERQDRAKRSVTELTQQLRNFASNREGEVRKAKARVAASKKDLAAATAKAKAAAQAVATAQLEAEELAAEEEAARDAIQQAKTSAKDNAASLGKLERTAASAKSAYEDAQGVFDELQGQVRAYDDELSRIAQARAAAKQQLADAEIERDTATHTLKKARAEHKAFVQRLVELERRHTWIRSEKQFFGQTGSDFDFSGIAGDVEARLAKLKKDNASLAKGINRKVMGMFEKAEQEYRDLSEKKRIIENDKAKIQAVIAGLDVKKREALQATYSQVNRDFGSIFSTLLPGAGAKLSAPTGMTIFDGMDVCVSFNGEWKDSLSELSGGQRSLIALSLILSLLLFKPAPLYILDEVDAALDLSHTQNIGRMLKQHFSHAQFVVVSLKEGMFNNANVLFRTKFVDGVSTITRTVGGGSSGGRARLGNKENVAGKGRARGSGKRTAAAAGLAQRNAPL